MYIDRDRPAMMFKLVHNKHRQTDRRNGKASQLAFKYILFSEKMSSNGKFPALYRDLAGIFLNSDYNVGKCLKTIETNYL